METITLPDGNNVIIGVNNIYSSYGKTNLNNYIQKELKKGNIVKIKNKSASVSEKTAPITAPYNNSASVENIISPEDTDVNTAFRDWAHNAGYADDLSIERIDNNKDYCPENCKWIPLGDQSKNRSTSVVYEYNGKKQILKDWCREYNMPYNSVHSRIKYHGWSFEKALFTPIDKRKSTKGKMEQM
ncbi:MAG: hypothetical protein IKS04_06780 [Clostridia bacterium]|nr:hypothetical protein [Clostridia bacterium]